MIKIGCFTIMLWAVLFTVNAQEKSNAFLEGKGITIVYDGTIGIEKAPAKILPPLENGPLISGAADPFYYKGTLKNGFLQGAWISKYENGFVCDSGHFVKGLPDGYWKFGDTNGTIRAIRHYSAEKYKKVIQAFTNHHPKQPQYPIVALYKTHRSFVLEQLLSSGSFPPEKVHESSNEMNVLLQRNVSGMGYSPLFNKLLHHGLYINYDAKGVALDSGYYKNGLREGEWIHRKEQGVLWKGWYEHGFYAGIWKMYNRQGALKALITYNKEGVEISRKTF